MTGSAELWGTLLATTLLMVLHWVVAKAAARRPWLSHLVEGRPVALGKDGDVDADVLARHSVSEADLDEALRAASLDTADGARLVVLEPSGRISVLRR